MEPQAPGLNVRDAHEVLEYRDDVIWRYINYAKFISMLDTGALYFSRLDQFDDRHEAAISKPAFERGVVEAREYMEAHGKGPVTEEDARERAALVEAGTTKVIRESVLVNCWHRSPVESGAMWAVYGNQGMAISSTIGSLFECTKHHRPSVMIQWVYYVDHGVQDFDFAESFLFKHRLYAYEQEIRALILFPPGEPAPSGTVVECNLEQLVHSVHLPPGASGLQQKAIQSLLTHYRLPQIEAVRSEADTIPDYRTKYDEILTSMKGAPLAEGIAKYRAAQDASRQSRS